jgi:hypothetical protein
MTMTQPVPDEGRRLPGSMRLGDRAGRSAMLPRATASRPLCDGACEPRVAPRFGARGRPRLDTWTRREQLWTSARTPGSAIRTVGSRPLPVGIGRRGSGDVCAWDNLRI